MDDMEVTRTDAQSAPSEMQKTALLWGAIALGLSILMVAVNTSPAVLKAGFFAKTFGVLLGAVFGTVGALAGDALRKFAKPDFMMTRGGMASLVWMKLFWMLGPQVIGVLIGSVLGASLILN